MSCLNKVVGDGKMESFFYKILDLLRFIYLQKIKAFHVDAKNGILQIFDILYSNHLRFTEGIQGKYLTYGYCLCVLPIYVVQ